MRLKQASLVAYIAMAHGLVHTVEFTYAALLSRIDDEFGAGLFVLGVVANGFAFTFGFSALPSGFLVDRLGTQRVLFLAFASAAAMSTLVALAPNAALLGLCLGLLGLSVGLYHPAGLSFIAQATTQRGLALGWHGVVGNLGIALAPALAVGVAEATDWRWAYGVLAVLLLAVAGSLRLVRMEPVRAPALEMVVEAAQPGVEDAPPPHEPAPAPAASLAALAPLLLVYAVFVLNGFVYRGSLLFLPTHIEERVRLSWFGLDEDALATSMTTVALLAGAAGQIFGGMVSERVRLERLAVPFTLSMFPFLLLMGLVSGLPLVLFAALFVFANFSGQPVYTGLIADYSPQQALGRSYGVSFFAAFGIGSSAATVAGFFADRWGTDAVFLALSGIVLVTSVLALTIWHLSERASPAAPAQREAPAAGWGGE